MTIKADATSRPHIGLAVHREDRVWEPFISTDRSLVIEGLELDGSRSTKNDMLPETAHLIYSEHALLCLADCHLLAPRGCALVVCRDPQSVELSDCLVLAHASAVCVEAGARAPEIRMTNNRITVNDARGAAMALWKSIGEQAGATRLYLEHNAIQAGRILSLAGPARGIEVMCHDNTFLFHEALLSCAGFTGLESPRQALQWRGGENHYKGSADWLSVNGVPVGIRGLLAWREFWRTAEAGSHEEGPLQQLKTVHYGLTR